MFTARMSRINLTLDADMCRGFTLQLASTPIVIQLLGESPLDIARTSHVALDQIAVVAVRDAKKLSKALCRCLVEALAELRRAPRDVCKNIGEALRDGVESGGFDAVRRLHVPIIARSNALKVHSKCRRTADLCCRSAKGIQLIEIIAYFALIPDFAAEPWRGWPAKYPGRPTGKGRENRAESPTTVTRSPSESSCSSEWPRLALDPFNGQRRIQAAQAACSCRQPRKRAQGPVCTRAQRSHVRNLSCGSVSLGKPPLRRRDNRLPHCPRAPRNGASPSQRLTYLSRIRAKPFTFQDTEFVPVLVPLALRQLPEYGGGPILIHRQGLPVRLTGYERTLVDVLDAPDHGGGWEEIWRSLEGIEFVDLDLVVGYALSLGSALTVARVGFFLDQHRDELLVEERHFEALHSHAPKRPQYFERRQRKGGKLL